MNEELRAELMQMDAEPSLNAEKARRLEEQELAWRKAVGWMRRA